MILTSPRLKIIKIFAIISCLVYIIGCNTFTNDKDKNTQTSQNKTTLLIDSVSQKTMTPSQKQYIEDIKNTLLQPIPILRSMDIIDPKLKLAQEVAINAPVLHPILFDSITHEPMRNEVMNVYQTRESDLNPQTKNLCTNGNCFKVEIFNFTMNKSISLIVNIDTKLVIGASIMNQSQPEISPRLKKIALEMAALSPEVVEALGYKPDESSAVMTSTKTSLNKSRCERSQHLCVAPTFVKEDKALWAIVDLTDLRLIGIRWTNVGVPEPAAHVSERKIQNDAITECCCKIEIPLERDNWNLTYMLTSSDGLRISSVKYKNTEVISNAKLVDWHVSYSNTEGFGYSDAIGCPYFSTAAVLALEPPRIRDIEDENGQVVGFAVEQNFYSEGWPRPCNYNYLQRYEFYKDGRFRPIVASLGRGCGNDGTYRPVTRIAFPNNSNFYQWENNDWSQWTMEKWNLQKENSVYSKEGYLYKIQDTNNQGFYIEPSRGQFGDNGRGDFAYTFVTKRDFNKDEGETDLVTIGPCCNTDYRQGPEKFIEPNPEPISNTQLVLWYVPTIKNDNTKGHEYCWAETYIKDGVVATKTYPCNSGPMFHPLK